jgi:DNA repair protein NreA
MLSNNQCLMCKGSRMLCRNKYCPLLSKIKSKISIPKIKENFSGASGNIFVGKYGYPNVNIGPIASFDHSEAKSPSQLFGTDYNKVIDNLTKLVRGEVKQNVFSKARFVQDNKLLALAKKPAETEFLFKSAPKMDIKFSDINQPSGPIGYLKKMKITENVKIAQKVDKIVSDEIKANESSFQLYKIGEDVYKITNILSSGALGIEKNQKLVPTRWSITATDDLITKNLLTQVRQNSQINNYFVFESTYIGNHFIILLEPGNWEFENFEAWAPGSNWDNGDETSVIEEYEPFQGRKKYADKQAGGYYAARLGIIEFLSKIKKQARVISFREISEEYVLSLGVWVVRETVRNAFKQKPIIFSSREEALTFIKTKLRVPFQSYINQSELLRQKKLDYFFN